jgi:hypothetical protein
MFGSSAKSHHAFVEIDGDIVIDHVFAPSGLKR